MFRVHQYTNWYQCLNLTFRCTRGTFVACLFYLYPPVTRKRRWRYMLDESAPAYRSYPFPRFPVISFDFLPLNLLLIRNHQAEIIIVKRLIQGR